MNVVLAALNKPSNYALALHYLKLYSLADPDLRRTVRFTLLQSGITVALNWMVARILAARPHLVGFSCNIWNVQRTLKLARLLKQVRPDLVIVLGGQEMTGSCIPYLERNPQVDIIVDGEGEEVFRQVLRRHALAGGAGLEEVLGIQDRREGRVQANPPAPPPAGRR